MKLTALLAGTALALVPTAPAFAGGTGAGKALGNCANSSAGGVHAPLMADGRHGNGNGGLRHVACTADDPADVVVVDTPGSDSKEPPLGGGSGGGGGDGKDYVEL